METQHEGQPLGPRGGQPYIATATFARLPRRVTFDKGEADLAILGIPWDGMVTHRPGARFGPRGIRESSVGCRNYNHHMEVAVYEGLRCVDAGDVAIETFDYEETFRQIQSRVGILQSAGAAVLSLGGDHSILLPILRATSAAHPHLTLVQFDAHTDTSDAPGAERYHHGTWVRRALEEGLIEGRRVFQIGIRGSFGSERYLEYVKQAGINVLDMHAFHDPRRLRPFLETLREVAGSGPCYLTFDIDGIDPAFAPGTGTPVPGGLTSFEALDMLRQLRGLRFVGGDVVEVAPVYDHAEITSLLGASLALQIAALIAIGKGEVARSLKGGS